VIPNPVSFRLPSQIAGKADPDVVEAIEYHDDAINDLQQAIPHLVSQIDALKAATPGTGTTSENVVSQSENTVITPSTIGTVNNQAGNTSYATQQSDYGSLIVLNDASAIAVTLTTGGVIQTPWFCFISNEGTGTATLTPASGTINGAGSMALSAASGAICFFDGINFWTLGATSGGGGGYTPAGGPTSSRPGSPTTYEVYFDTTLGFPVWWTGSAWVNASGMPS
jgi:hypothetical protein